MLLPRTVLIALFLSVVATSALSADDATIAHLAAVTRGEAVSVALTLENSFDDPWRLEAIQNGLPLVFVYQIDLIRKHENWFDSLVRSTEIEVVATYNSLTREYLLNYRRDRKLVSSENIRNLDELQRRMTTVSEQSLFPLEGRRPGKLRVRARAILGRRYLFHVIPRPITTRWEAVRVQERPAP